MKFKFALLIFAISSICYSQDKEIKLDTKNSLSQKFLPLWENAFLLKQFRWKDDKSKITCYDNKGEVLWENSLDVEYSKKAIQFTSISPTTSAYRFENNFLVKSKSSNWVYNVEMKSNQYYQKPHYVTQISKDGKLKKFVVEGREELGRNLQTSFCDEKFFYYLATDDGNEMLPKKKSSEKLILNRFDAKDFAYKRVILDLPAVEEGSNTTFWKYAGQSETEKYLVSKSIDLENDKIVFNIAAFDEEGKVTRLFSIDLKLNNKFVRPSHRVNSIPESYYQSAELDFELKQPKGSHYFLVDPTNGGFSDIKFDEGSESFYVFGLYGPKQYKRIAPVYDGFYVYKFDKKGMLQWQLQENASPELANEKQFSVHGYPGMRNIELKLWKGNIINFTIQFNKDLFGYVISKDGKITKRIRKENYKDQYDNLMYGSETKIKSEDYIRKANAASKKEAGYSNYLTSEGEILFKNESEITTIFFFKH